MITVVDNTNCETATAGSIHFDKSIGLILICSGFSLINRQISSPKVDLAALRMNVYNFRVNKSLVITDEAFVLQVNALHTKLIF